MLLNYRVYEHELARLKRLFIHIGDLRPRSGFTTIGGHRHGCSETLVLTETSSNYCRVCQTAKVDKAMKSVIQWSE